MFGRVASFEHFKRAQKTNAQSAAGEEEEERTNEGGASLLHTPFSFVLRTFRPRIPVSHIARFCGLLHSLFWYNFEALLFWINLSKRRRGIHKQSSRVKFKRDLTLNARDRALDI